MATAVSAAGAQTRKAITSPRDPGLDSDSVLVLTVRVAGEAPRRVLLDRKAITLGRSSVSDLPIADRTLSRAHAKIDNTTGQPVLSDLDSRNGTILNGRRIAGPAPIQAGDRVVIGETLIEIGMESTAPQVVIEEPLREKSLEHTLFRSSNDLVRQQRERSGRGLGTAELSRLNESLRILNEVSVELLNDLPVSRLLSVILDKVFSYLEPDRGFLMLGEESGALKPEVMKFADGIDPSDIRLSQTIVREVVENRHGVLMLDTKTSTSLSAADSIRLQGVTSCMAAPLFVGEKVMGLIYLDVRLGRKSFNEDDLRLLSSLANTAAIKLENLRLQEAAATKQLIEREMALAWEVQRRLLPERVPVRAGAEFLGRTSPSRTVSGDYYDFFERPDSRVDVVVADVSGKGMAASILAASVQAAFQAWAGENFAPESLCTRLNDMVYRRTNPEKFVTFFTGLFDARVGTLHYTNAGHNPGIHVRRDGTIALLNAHGTPLGLFPGQRYSASEIALEKGDLVALYTDGITEAADPKDQEFGLERLQEILVRNRSRELEEIEQSVGEGLAEFASGIPFHDDRTLVLLRRNA